MDTGPLELLLGWMFWPMLALMLLTPIKFKITVKDKTFVLRLKQSWTCLMVMVAFTMKLIVDVVHGHLFGVVLDVLLLLIYSRFYRYAKDDEDKDDEDRKGKRAARQFGEKSKARIRELVRSLKPSPAPRPLPVRN